MAGITSSPGATTDRLMNVRGLSLYSSNILYVADKDNNRVQRWLIGALNGSTVAGRADGIPGAALNELFSPTGTALDSSGNIYVADSGNHRVVFWESGEFSGTIVAGNGRKLRPTMNFLHVFLSITTTGKELIVKVTIFYDYLCGYHFFSSL